MFSTADGEQNSDSTSRSGLELAGIALLLAGWGFGLYYFAGPPVAKLPAWPGWDTLDVLIRSRWTSVDGVVQMTVLALWAVWALLVAWLVASLLVELVLVAAEHGPAKGTGWVRRVHAAVGRIAFPLVHRTMVLAFAINVAVRPPSVGVAEAQPVSQVWATQTTRASSQTGVMAQTNDEAVPVRHTVQVGDTLWAIAERYYGTGEEFDRLIQANDGRRMADGATFTPAGVIRPGWALDVPLPAARIEVHEDGRYYVVQRGDTLRGIAARLLGDEERYRDLFELNVGTARLGDSGALLRTPDLIWPDLRLLLPVDASPSDIGDSAPPPEASIVPLVVVPAAAVEPTMTPTPTSELAVIATTSPTESNGGENNVGAAGAGNAADPVVPPPAEAPVRAVPGETSVQHWPELSTAEIAGGAAAAVVLSALVLRALRARRRVPRPLEPENDTRVDAGDFTLAEPAAVLAARRGGGDDPHGIVLGERIAAEILRRAARAGVTDVHVVTVDAGRTHSDVALAAPLANRSRLETTMRAATDLAGRVTVTRSREQDVVVRLEGVRREAIGGLAADASPVLLCLGLRLDLRAWLVGWEALGHVLVAGHPETVDAQEHLAALVATLAGQCAPADLRLYTLSTPEGPLGLLARLPHQRATAEPRSSTASRPILASLRAEIERRQQAGLSSGSGEPELALVIEELSSLSGEPDLAYLLTHGRECGLRVLAATADPAAERGPLVESFESRIVFGLADEEASTRLLGNDAAETLLGAGHLFARLGRRKEVEVLGLHLTEAGRRELFAAMGVDETPSSAPWEPVAVDPARHTMLSPTGAGPIAGVGDESTNNLNGERETAAALEAAEVHAVSPRADTGEQESPANGVAFPGTHRNGAIHVSLTDEARLPAVPQPGAVGEAPTSSADTSSSTSECPDHMRALLDTAPLVISCEDESLWSIRGRLALPRQSAFIELLVYLGAARLQAPEPLDPWPGVAVDTLLDEVWTPRARDPQNRESGQTWLRKSLKRLQEELATAAGGLPGEIVAGGQLLRLNPTTIASDVEVFLTALARAKAARGADRIAAAEEALAKRVSGLLLNVPRERVLVGRTIEIYRWLDLPHWERAAGRLEALGREAAVQLGRAYRDGGRYDAAMVLYGQLLGEVPHDRRVQEGLLLAARGTGDSAQLSQVWQQVRAYLDGETDIELHSMYERLMSETRAASAVAGRVVPT